MKIEGDPNEYGVFSTITTTTHHLSQEDEYQVFLNFRGFDTRLNFTDFLYIYLENNGVRTFRDSNKLHIGEKIGPKLLKSIRKSKISIPIFSKNYASSKWFYDVQPSDLKDKDGIYAKALRELQESESLDDETIEQWKEALRVVAGLKGMDVEKQADGRHAFGRKLLPEECDSISEEVASTAAGLPLALEHTGSFLSDKDPAIWQDILKKLKKKLHDKVEKRFRESYEALNNDQKQIFLDISCLFDGTDKATVFYMWGDCGYHPKIEFNVLSLLSLVKVGDANELRMHYQLSALGRNIVCEERIPGKRSRLWDHVEALSVLKRRMGTERVEALSLCFELESTNRHCFTRKEFKKLKYLWYLQVDGTDLAGDFEDLLFHLRWLNWRGCSPYFQLTNFCLENLVILDLSNSCITEDWGGWSHFKLL